MMQVQSQIDNFDGLIDVVTEITGEQISDAEAEFVFRELPKHTQFIAQEWTCSDTVFKDDAFGWLKAYPKALENAKMKYNRAK